jgi:sugar lactone lactonase YvrE
MSGSINPAARVAFATSTEIGECPIWCHRTQTLWWIDVFKGLIHSSTDPRSPVHALPAPIGSIGLMRTGGLMAATSRGIVLIGGDRQNPEFIADPIGDHETYRFNDGKVDPMGRFWVGTMRRDGTKDGELWAVSRSGRTQKLLEGLSLSNGMGWSPDGRRFFHIDSNRWTLTAFDCDLAQPSLANGSIIHTFDDSGGNKPDGLAVSRDGDLWVTIWGGGRILRLSPAGAIKTEIKLPVSRPASCAFGGTDMRTAFVTTARYGLSATELEREPDSGSILSFEAGIEGLPTALFG